MERMDREMTLDDSRMLELRRLLLQIQGDPEITPSRVMWATSDGREKLLRR